MNTPRPTLTSPTVVKSYAGFLLPLVREWAETSPNTLAAEDETVLDDLVEAINNWQDSYWRCNQLADECGWYVNAKLVLLFERSKVMHLKALRLAQSEWAFAQGIRLHAKEGDKLHFRMPGSKAITNGKVIAAFAGPAYAMVSVAVMGTDGKTTTEIVEVGAEEVTHYQADEKGPVLPHTMVAPFVGFQVVA